jgi:tubulin--tyrosine ligase-like protein 12
VSKYVEDPVLIDRDDAGLVKFDLRFVVLMTSAKPLELAVHQKFIVRVANKYVLQ